MEASELRKGNWVNTINHGNVKIKQFVYDEIRFEFKDDGRTAHEAIDKTNPIVITEEWLIKFGFEKDEELNDVFSRLLHDSEGMLMFIQFDREYLGNEVVVSLQDTTSGTEDCDDEVLLPGKNEYVHQLQNLYFALTGEEL